MTTRKEIERLFRSNYQAMHTFAARLLRDGDAARGIVHDVLSGLLLAEISDVTTAYLLRAVRNQCLNRLRHLSAKERMHGLYAADLQAIADEEWPDDATIAKMQEIVGTLPDRCRRVVRLRFTDGLSYKQISDTLCISEVMVYKHLRHALDVLRLNLKNDGQD